MATFDQFYGALTKLVSRPNECEIDILFNSLDKTGDGLLRSDDFTSNIPDVRALLQEIWAFIRDEFDQNWDRQVTRAEFHRGIIIKAYQKTFRSPSGNVTYANSFNHIVRNFNAELAMQLRIFRQRVSEDHIIAYQHTNGSYVCPTCYCKFPNQRGSLKGIAEGTSNFNPRLIYCSYPNCRMNLSDLQNELVPAAVPLESPVHPSINQRELMRLDPVHARVYLPQIKNLISDGIKRQINSLFGRLDKTRDGKLTVDDFRHFNPGHDRNLKRLWTIINDNFDFIADNSIDKNEFFEGFVLHSYLETDPDTLRSRTVDFSSAFMTWLSRLADDMVTKLHFYENLTTELDSVHVPPPVSPPHSPHHPAPVPEPMTPEERRAYIAAFRRIDVDGNDEIDFWELKTALTNLGFFPITNDLVQRMMNEADVRHPDGKIDFDEFCNICRKLSNQSADWARVRRRILSDVPGPPPPPPQTDVPRRDVRFDDFSVGDICHYRGGGGVTICTITQIIQNAGGNLSFVVRFDDGRQRQVIAENLTLIERGGGAPRGRPRRI